MKNKWKEGFFFAEAIKRNHEIFISNIFYVKTFISRPDYSKKKGRTFNTTAVLPCSAPFINDITVF